MADKCFPGEFPDCGCYYNTDDDGIHFCPMHKAAPDMLKALEEFLEANARHGYEFESNERRVYSLMFDAICKAKGISTKLKDSI